MVLPNIGVPETAHYIANIYTEMWFGSRVHLHSRPGPTMPGQMEAHVGIFVSIGGSIWINKQCPGPLASTIKYVAVLSILTVHMAG
jgi:hypothetical protein